MANQMAYIIISMRSSLIYAETPGRKLMLVWFLISLLICVIGVRTIYRNENSYVKVI